MPQTPNHNYNVPNEGAKDWHRPLNENFRQYDTDIEIRDADGNKGDYEPKQGAKFLATDTGLVYEGDGKQWQPSMVLPRSDGNGSVALGDPSNTAANGAAVLGGRDNTAGGASATITGGISSDAPGRAATVTGGRDHNASGNFSTVLGGRENLARENYSFAAGRKAKARAVGSFVWGDSSSQFIESLTENEVVFQAGGGLTMWTESDLSKGLQVDSDGGRVQMGTINGSNLRLGGFSGDFVEISDSGVGIGTTNPNDRGLKVVDTTGVTIENPGTGTSVDLANEASGGADALVTTGGCHIKNGKLRVEGNATITGDLTVNGSKNFVQSVDTPDGEREVVYTASEAPTPRTEASGVAELEDGRAEIELPDHFGWVTDEEEPIHVQTTPYSTDSGGLAAVERSPDRVVVEDLDGEGDYEFSYTVRGTRDGYADKEVVREPSGEEPNAQKGAPADD